MTTEEILKKYNVYSRDLEIDLLRYFDNLRRELIKSLEGKSISDRITGINKKLFKKYSRSDVIATASERLQKGDLVKIENGIASKIIKD